ncbi:MAG: DUF885 domain-containing protein [Myxococcota bacterium]
MRPHLLLPVLLGACVHASTPDTLPPPGDLVHAAGVDDPELRDLVARHWSWVLGSSPEFATRLGIHDRDDELADPRWSAVQERNRVRRSLRRAVAALDPGPLSKRDQTTQALLLEELDGDIGAEACRFSLWSISPRSNPVTHLNYLPQGQPRETPAQVRALLARLSKGAENIDHTIANLRQGASEGWYPNRESTSRVLEMVETQLSEDLDQWPMLKDALPVELEAWSEADVQSLRAEATRVVDDEVRPALERYRNLVRDELLPHARTEEVGVGLAGLPFGEACYAARIRHFTTLEMTAQEIHERGLSELKRINGQMAEIGTRALGANSLEDTLTRLRSDPALYFDDETSIVATAEDALARARSVLPAFFDRLPQATCVVREIPAYEAPFTTIAYYRQPVPDGSEPGAYYVNTYEPKTRPRYEAEALAFHESIPGHHLQIAIAQELDDVPAFRKHAGMTVFVEGWALYAEQLSDEMGLYGGDLDQLGKLSYEAWRASRLVVDTGLHAMGWSRKRAADFMAAHTALALNNIDNEVDRYIVWPGQALAYKTGQMEIMRLRAEAEAALGESFELPAFHDALLLGGAVSLPVLRQQVADYVASAQKP